MFEDRILDKESSVKMKVLLISLVLKLIEKNIII